MGQNKRPTCPPRKGTTSEEKMQGQKPLFRQSNQGSSEHLLWRTQFGRWVALSHVSCAQNWRNLKCLVAFHELKIEDYILRLLRSALEGWEKVLSRNFFFSTLLKDISILFCAFFYFTRHKHLRFNILISLAMFVLSSCRNTSGGLGEREMLGNTSRRIESVSTAFSSSPKLSRVFL